MGSQHLFNPCDAPEEERIPAKIWELLRRNNSFREAVNRLRQLDECAKPETAAIHSVAREHAQAARAGDNTRLAAIQKRRDKVKDRPIKRQADALIEEHQKTHRLAALALLWLSPEPGFFIRCKRRGRIQEGHGYSPDLGDPSWSWRNSDEGKGRKPAVKVGGETFVRGPSLCAKKLSNPFPDWKGWQPGEALFDYTTPWNGLSKSFKSRFASEWRTQYDSKDAYEFPYVHPPLIPEAKVLEVLRLMDSDRKGLWVRSGCPKEFERSQVFGHPRRRVP